MCYFMTFFLIIKIFGLVQAKSSKQFIFHFLQSQIKCLETETQIRFHPN